MPKRSLQDRANEEAVEEAYLAGASAAWRLVLQTALHEIGRDVSEWTAARLIAEREAAIIQLRALCAMHGDNDWPDSLSLAEILQKHLAPHL